MKIEKNLKIAAKFLVLVLFITGFVSAVSAQKRRTVRKRTSARAASTIPVSNSVLIKGGAQKVSTQIKNVSKFVYVLGGVAKDIEALDKDIRDRKIINRQLMDKNERDKMIVVQSIANLQAGLAALETEFNTTPALKIYGFQLQGIGAMAGIAKNEAVNGQLTQSGKTLLMIIEKLSDVLVSMP